jgi:hypothetical protein
VQAILAPSAPVTLTLPNSQTTYAVFDLGDVPLLPAGQPDPVWSARPCMVSPTLCACACS